MPCVMTLVVVFLEAELPQLIKQALHFGGQAVT